MGIEDLIRITVKKEKKEILKEDKWINRYMEVRRFHKIKESTLKSDAPRLKVFIDYCYNTLKKAPDELTKTDFVKFFNFLSNERKISVNTQDKYFKNLKVAYRIWELPNIEEFAEECKEWKMFSRYESKPFDEIDGKQVGKIIDQILKSKSRTKIRDALIIRLLWDTGARVGEILKLTYKDSNLKDGIFVLRDTKGRETREAVCSMDTLEAIKMWIQYNITQEDDDPLFQNNNGESVTYSWISEVFRKQVELQKEKGIIPKNKRISLHSLRHGRTTQLLDNGIGLEIVGSYMGHKSIKTTMRYAHANARKNKQLKEIQRLIGKS
jgi:integrase/recombinase XerD